jgi:hypothetical protein
MTRKHPGTSLTRARAAKKRVVAEFSHLSCVTGVGITRLGDDYAVKVNVSERVDPGELPAEIDGVRVCVEVTGKIRAR